MESEAQINLHVLTLQVFVHCVVQESHLNTDHTESFSPIVYCF